jgi:hypothetical protein
MSVLRFVRESPSHEILRCRLSFTAGTDADTEDEMEAWDAPIVKPNRRPFTVVVHRGHW